MFTSCVDDDLIQDKPKGEDFNINAFSKGYSVAFDMTLDRFGGDLGTRVTDYELAEIENHLDPEEFRVLFFDKDDNFLFESKSRWFTEVDALDGNKRWRVGVPIFQYLSDSYDDNNSTEDDGSIEERYNWEEIVSIMKNSGFKIAILANRPTTAKVPSITDWPEDGSIKWSELKSGYADNGPFWTAKNSIATPESERGEEEVKKVFDLHHCQFDPVYFSKSVGKESQDEYGARHYDFLMEYGEFKELNVPFMGAVSTWLKEGERDVAGKKKAFYKLPDETQYIPMYGIQSFDPITDWTKGTTYNISTQTSSQSTYYAYKSIFLLRSVVKLELRIPMFDKEGNYVDVNNEWAQIWYNNCMARCEPMDLSTPTNEIWASNHTKDCEWNRIKNYGLFAGTNRNNDEASFKKRLSWYYGVWRKNKWWDFEGDGITTSDVDANLYPEGHEWENPRIFNPITQRLTSAFICDNYLPITGSNDEYQTDEDGKEILNRDGNKIPVQRPGQQYYHRWVVYCGERNNMDPTYLGELTSSPKVAYFRIQLKKSDNWQIYDFPITNYNADYSEKDYNILDYLEEDGGGDEEIQKMEANGTKQNMTDYVNDIESWDPDYQPYPVLRNHFYRITVSFDSTKDIDIEIMDSEERDVYGIYFN